jgi:hypothetical protein
VPTLTVSSTNTSATSITEVIQELDNVIDWCVEKKSRIGYFATLYKKMTVAVQQGIQQNRFADGKRMERLDVIFANRYLSAWKAYTTKQPCTNAWCAAFDASESNKLIVLQHLLLGINTHINLDLGIAAAETAGDTDINLLKSDFEMINDVIAHTSNDVQETLCRIWFPLRFINRISNNREDAVINFSIKTARQASWSNAVALSLAKGQARTNHVNFLDNGVVAVANRIKAPGMYVSMLLWPVLKMEDKEVSKIIKTLA